MTNSTDACFKIGGDLKVDRLGFGGMRLTGQPGNYGPFPDWAAGLELLRTAAVSGVNFFDSARAYGPLFVDKIMGEALDGLDVVIATKGGLDKQSSDRISVDGSRDKLLREVDEALENLRRDQIDLFQLHRIDPKIPLEVSVAALAEAKADGRIRHIGLSKVTREQLDRALTIAPIVSVQNRFNMAETGDGDLVDYTAKKGIAFIPYGPLGANPMQQGAKLKPREALAWLLKRSANIVVIPGTTSMKHMLENVTAWDLV